MSGPACDRCRIKHISCDRKRPCQHCVKGRVTDGCHYTPKRRAGTVSLSSDRLRKRASDGFDEENEASHLKYDLRNRRDSSPSAPPPPSVSGSGGDPYNNRYPLPAVVMGSSEPPPVDMYSLKNLSNGEEIFGSIAPIQMTSHIPNVHLYPPMMLFLPSIAGHPAVPPPIYHPMHGSHGHAGPEPFGSFPLDIIKHFEMYGAGNNDK